MQKYDILCDHLWRGGGGGVILKGSKIILSYSLFLKLKLAQNIVYPNAASRFSVWQAKNIFRRKKKHFWRGEYLVI